MKNKKIKKPTLVFIHYFGGDGGSWKWIDKKISKKQQCVYLTLPGFGNTEPLKNPSIRDFSDWIINEIKSLKIEDYILIGHSMGGKLALFTAFISPEFLPKKIVLIAPSPPTVENMPENEKRRMLNHPNKEEAETTVKNAIRKNINKTKYKYAVESQLKIDSNTWKWWITKGMNNDISWAVKNLKIPTFVIYSKNDPVITTEDIQNEVLPNTHEAKLISFGKCGHLIPLESSRKLTKIINKISKG